MFQKSFTVWLSQVTVLYLGISPPNVSRSRTGQCPRLFELTPRLVGEWQSELIGRQGQQVDEFARSAARAVLSLLLLLLLRESVLQNCSLAR
jgi:hypothetical protein